MSKKRKSKEAKSAHKNLDKPQHTGAYQDQADPEHKQISSTTQRPQGNLPTPQGGDMWGSSLNPTDVLQPGGM
jgi:hypothetical protein